MMVRGPEPKQVEDSRVVHLRPRREPAEFPGELHEGEVSPAKGKDAGGELHHLGGRGWVVLGPVFCHGCTGVPGTRRRWTSFKHFNVT